MGKAKVEINKQREKQKLESTKWEKRKNWNQQNKRKTKVVISNMREKKKLEKILKLRIKKAK